MAENAVNPSAMTVEEAAAMLRIDADAVRGHIAAGLPVTADGRIHLVEYVAWMILRLRQVGK